MIVGRMMNQRWRSSMEALTICWVSIGSWPPSCVYMFWKTGTRKSSIAVSTSNAKAITRHG